MNARPIAEGISWLGELLGGTVVDHRLQERWRPHVFCTVAGRSGEQRDVLLRGFRNPGYIGDESMMRFMLLREAAVLEALADTAIPVPAYLGVNPALGWLAMELVQGEELLTGVADVDRRSRIFGDYLRIVGQLHDLDLDSLSLPAELFATVDERSAIDGPLARYEQMAQLTGPSRPDPLVDLGRQWLAANRPSAPSGIGLQAGDIGPNQFFFDGDRVTALFDLELADTGDPYQDLGLLRLREMCYPIGDLPQQLEQYAANRGHRLDHDLLQWWTVLAMLSGPLVLSPVALNPRPQLLDQVSVYAYEPIYRRGLVESLAEVHGVELEGPTDPGAHDSWRDPLHELLTAQLEDIHGPACTDDIARFWMASSTALSRSLSLGARIGTALDHDDVDDLESVLGRRPAGRDEGLAELSAAITAGPEDDLEARLGCLYRIQVRRERVLEPIQTSMGFASQSPLARLV